MPNSPRLGWPFPSEFADPWFEAFQAMVTAMDASAYASREDRHIVIVGGGTVAFSIAGPTGTLSWSSPIELTAAITGFLWTIPAGSVLLNDGDVFFVNLVRAPTGGTALVATVGIQVPSSDAALLIGVRKGTRIFFRNGDVIQDGESIPLFEAGPSGVSFGSPVAQVFGTGADDVSALAARADHVHPMFSATPVTTGVVNSVGAALTPSRSDHTHRTGLQLLDEGVLIGTRPRVNFVGAGIIATDDAGNDRVNVTVTSAVLTGAFPTTILPDDVAVVGVAVDAARADHKHAIAASGPIALLNHGSLNSEGFAPTFARSDHSHAFTAPLNPADVSKSPASAGVGAAFAREDHKHDVSTAGPAGTFDHGSGNAEGVATSLARSDHSHAFSAPAAPANVTKAAASAGVAAPFARADHKHDVNTAAPTTDLSLSTSNSEGVATTLARSDHTHAVDFSGGGGIQQATAVGNDTTASLVDVLMVSMTITPGAGDYMVWASTTGSNSSAAAALFVSIYVAGVQVAHTERSMNASGGDIIPISTHAYVTGVLVAQAVELRWRVTAGTGTANQRTLTLMRVN